MFAVPSAVQSVIDALVEAVRREHDHVDVVLGRMHGAAVHGDSANIE